VSISITTADVKRKCMVSTSEHDSSISSLISEMQPALEHSIADAYLNDTSNTNLQATLKLGMLEMIAGEFLEQLRREVGASGEVSVAGISLGAEAQTGADLIQQGATRLAPYLKAALPLMSESMPASTTSGGRLTFDSRDEVW